jgi:energy-converting hydrogenase Eha subunit E
MLPVLAILGCCLQDMQEQWDKIENKPQVALYAGSSILVLWLTSTVIGAINSLPVVCDTCLVVAGGGVSLMYNPLSNLPTTLLATCTIARSIAAAQAA